MSQVPDSTPRDLAGATGQKSYGCWLYAILGVGIVALLIGLLLPAVRFGREPARNANCKSNLKQIMLAMHTYADQFGEFPPAYTVDADGKPLHSWRTLLLPWLEGRRLYEKLDLSKPWDDPVNAEVFENYRVGPNASAFRPPAYVCPSSDCPPGHTNYLAIVTPNSCLRPGKGRPLADVQDKSNTLAVIEVPAVHSVPWMAPVDADEALVLVLGSSRLRNEFSHPNGFNAAYSDGSVKFFLDGLSAEKRRALISIDAKDKVRELD